MINRVLFYNSGGGIGDDIQILPLINTLKNKFKNAKFLYLCSHENHFNSTLKDLNCKIDSLDLDVKYFGFRWWHALIVRKKLKKYNIEKFDLIIDLQSKIRNSLILKIIPHKYFVSSCFNFKLSNPTINIKKQKKINNNIINSINYLFKTFDEIKEFSINEIDKKFHVEAERLLPKNNYVGLSITQGNIYRKKEWPLDNFIKVCNHLNEINKIPVFFIEKKNKDLVNKIKKLIPTAVFPEHESDLSSPALVACLSKRLDLAISIDNGIMHMLSLAKVPIISLFGPTDSEKFAPHHKNSLVLDSKKIYSTNNVSSINVEDVLKAVKQLLDF